MKLMEILGQMSFSSLLNLVREYHLDDSSRSKKDIILILRKYLLDENRVTAWVKSLSPARLFYLLQLFNLLQKSNKNIFRPDLKNIFRACLQGNSDDFFHDVEINGLLLSCRLNSSEKEPRSICVDETVRIFIKTARGLSDKLFFPLTVSINNGSTPDALSNLRSFHFLMLFFMNKSIRLNKNDGLYKKDIEKLRIRLHDESNNLDFLKRDMPNFQKSPGSSIVYPCLVSVYLHFAFQNNFLRIEKDCLVFDQELYRRFAGIDYQKQYHLLFNYWLKLRLSSRFKHWVFYFLLKEFSSAEYICTIPFKKQKILDDYFLDELYKWGIINYGYKSNAKKTDYCCLTPFGVEALKYEEEFEVPCVHKNDNFFIIQPSFELFVPLYFPFKDFMALERFADIIRIDRWITYRIDRESLTGSFRNNFLSGDIIDFLKKHSKNEVPQNIIETIISEESQFNEISIKRMTLIHITREDIIKEITHLPGLDELFKEEIGNGYYRINDDDKENILSTLKRAGYHPNSHIYENDIKSPDEDEEFIKPVKFGGIDNLIFIKN